MACMLPPILIPFTSNTYLAKLVYGALDQFTSHRCNEQSSKLVPGTHPEYTEAESMDL